MSNGIQGKTFDTTMIIHDDGYHPWVTAEWIYTAISRARKLDDVIINVSESSNVTLTSYNMETMVIGYLCADQKADRTVSTPIDAFWIVNKAKVQHGCCYHCSNALNTTWKYNDPLNVSVDRLNNAEGHNKQNCVISCVRCNVTKK